MTPPFSSIRAMLRLVALLAFTTISGVADGISQDIEPAEANIGDQVIVTITFQNGSVNELQLPVVDGLQVVGSRTFSSIVFSNGTLSRTTTLKYAVVASRAGSFTLPPFDIHTNEGETLHVKAMKLLVYDNPSAPATNTTPAPAVPSSIPIPNTAANPNGPVVQPPANAAVNPSAPNNVNPAANTNPNIPRDPDGGPAKVFIIITPDVTDAYVGQSIQMRIDFFIRMEVFAEQNSLPTINGSNFLMNAFMRGGHQNIVLIENQQYGRETWYTAISAPKSGDFPLSMVRDTYWVKSITAGNSFDPFAFFNRRQNLAHLPITSNLLTMHIHPLPDEGRPEHFTGAIGQFQVTGDAHPNAVAIGEPVTLDFSVAGTGNFDYVRCPVLPDDPAWKQYVPSSKIDYRDESHLHAVKTFRQSIIPQKNGELPLPAASFSYFDPNTKQYVTIPISLPAISVTGTLAPLASSAPAVDADSTAVAAETPNAELLPNRLEIGSPRLSTLPVYRQTWFWVAQGGLLALPLLGGLIFFIRARRTPDDGSAERALRRSSLQQEEEAMAEAVRRDDAVAFFIAARHAVQLQLGAQWRVSPEALTLGEIRSRDAQLAETLAPLFAQADEVIYSGQAQPGVDLAQWENRVRTELLQPQPA
jgi:hypothetical protein